MGRGVRHHRPGDSQRARIATEAAGILAVDGVNDYQLAKQKAAARLGFNNKQSLPSNHEVELALREHLQIFQPAALTQRIITRRLIALKAMKYLDEFEPKLVGVVLSGCVTDSSEIQLHLVADTPELIAARLIDADIPYEVCSRRIRYGGNRVEEIPGYRFTAENVLLELLIFSPSGFREKPLSPIDGKSMKRAGIKTLQRLLETHSG